jgi:hypothetical protein
VNGGEFIRRGVIPPGKSQEGMYKYAIAKISLIEKCSFEREQLP